ncbi:hypothetical protein PBI_SCTP2_535 [Salicola phage SCTP-2]|nr:hypothetical protein PBI_SCTP2_535 [Salicola phage SCTP-2]
MQRRTVSFIEQIVNNFLGFIVSFFILKFIIVPLWGFQANVHDEFLITVLFFIISIIRGYIFRRVFNSIEHQTYIGSAIEQFFNVGSGFIIYLSLWSFVITPIWNFESTFIDDITINGIYFVFNYARALIVRRFFNYLTFKTYNST